MKVVFDITKTIKQMTPIPHQQSDIGKALKKLGLTQTKNLSYKKESIEKTNKQNDKTV